MWSLCPPLEGHSIRVTPTAERILTKSCIQKWQPASSLAATALTGWFLVY